jgi:hypothetical protein
MEWNGMECGVIQHISLDIAFKNNRIFAVKMGF